ncbi:MAG: hypothetical protein D6773_18135 [Alphaproteobacteria bacterium]|nr:MAG: hypothetical protein D6773_18135 [Alphaproteobacteria bacterium]
MEPLDPFDDDTTDTVFRDVILLTLVGFVAMVIMLLPHIQKKTEETEDHKAPGNVIVEMHWPSNMYVDVDLWVQAPHSTPVGFWNQGNDIFNLLRDDLGIEGDATNENYEISYSRGIRPGEYTVNVHMYSPVPKGLVVPVKVVVSVRGKYDSARQLLQTTVKLSYRNQEETAFRFRLTGEGELVKGSVSTLRRPLITGYRQRGD